MRQVAWGGDLSDAAKLCLNRRAELAARGFACKAEA
jgi:hypothetical protein